MNVIDYYEVVYENSDIYDQPLGRQPKSWRDSWSPSSQEASKLENTSYMLKIGRRRKLRNYVYTVERIQIILTVKLVVVFFSIYV